MGLYVIVSAQYLPSLGGVEKYTYELGKALVAQGNRVVVLTHSANEPGWSTEDGLEVVRLPATGLLGGRYPVPKKNACYHNLMEKVEALPIDAVVVNTRFYPLSIEGVRLAESKGVRPVVIDHGSAHLTLGNAAVDKGVALVEHAMTKRLMAYPADFYGVSAASVAWLKHFGIEAKGALPNAIDADAFVALAGSRNFRRELGIGPEDLLVAFTGRLVPEKGVATLIEAAKRLKENPIHIALAGDGPLRSAVEGAGLPKLHGLGSLAGPDVAALLTQADAFCLPTRSEGFSTSLLEAAACAATPVITKVGGVEELVPTEEFGLVLPSDTPDAVVDALMALSQNREACAQKGKALALRVREGFSWAETASKVREACHKAGKA